MDWDEVLRVALRRIDDARERLTSPRFRFEVRRKTFHVLGAVIAVPVLLLVPFLWGVALGVAIIVVMVAAWWLRKRRGRIAAERAARRARQKAGGFPELPDPFEAMEALTEPIGEAIERTQRPGETFPWAPVSFVLALLAVGIAVQLAGLPLSFAFAAYGILGVGDAASALIGVAYGFHKLPWSGKKSWEGLVAGILAGFLSAVVFGAVYYAWLGVPFPFELFAVFGAAALVGSLIESIPNVQDNWAVPVGSLATMVAVALGLGLPL